MSIFSLFKSSRKEPQQLPFHTDIHCHLVPGVDDGSPDTATSVEIIERMKGWGIDRIFLSPHVTQDTFENTPESLAGPYAELKDAVKAADIDM